MANLTQFAHIACPGISSDNVGAIISMKYSYRLIHSREVYFWFFVRECRSR